MTRLKATARLLQRIGDPSTTGLQLQRGKQVQYTSRYIALRCKVFKILKKELIEDSSFDNLEMIGSTKGCYSEISGFYFFVPSL